jgi:hypothetical protein
MTKLTSDPPVRNAVRREADKSLNLDRGGNFEALLGQMAGVIQEKECLTCQKKAGPWVGCVVFEGAFGGSCANCHYNSMDSRCSFSKFVFS